MLLLLKTISRIGRCVGEYLLLHGCKEHSRHENRVVL